jgi:hypothetical protein
MVYQVQGYYLSHGLVIGIAAGKIGIFPKKINGHVMSDKKFKIGDSVEILVANTDWARYGRVTATGFSDLAKCTVYKVESPNGFENWYKAEEIDLISPTPMMKVNCDN